MSDEQSGVPEGWSVVVESHPQDTAEAAKPSTNTALAMSGLRGLVPMMSRGAAEVATNPNMPRVLSSAGQLTGGLAELAKGNPLMVGPAAWAGGKGGYFTGKALQRAASPLAKAADAAEPVVKAGDPLLKRLIPAQGVLDLAQMAEPNRKDIGFMGIGSGTPDPQHPALLNDLAAKVRDYIMSKMGAQDPNAGGHP